MWDFHPTKKTLLLSSPCSDPHGTTVYLSVCVSVFVLSLSLCVPVSVCACGGSGGRGGPLTDVVLGDDAVVAQQQHVAEVQRAARAAQQQVLARVRAQQRHLRATAPRPVSQFKLHF